MPTESSPTVRATRRRILAGAAELFAERGIRGRSVREILEAVEVSRRTFYLYFANQDELVRTLYTDLVDNMLQAVGDALRSTPDARERIHRAVRAYVDYHYQVGPLLPVLMADAIGPDSPMAELRNAGLQGFEVLLAAATKETGGTILAPMMYRGLITGIEGVMLHAYGQGALTEEYREHLTTVVLVMSLQILTSGTVFPNVRREADPMFLNGEQGQVRSE